MELFRILTREWFNTGKRFMSADTPQSSIDKASDEVKLAVDLIYLFESQNIDPQVALSALEIVASDLKAKLAKV